MRGRSPRTNDEFVGIVVFGVGLAAAAGLNFAFSSLMGRMLEPPAFGTLGVLIAALLAVIGPVNALSGGTEMFAALHDRFPRGRKRLIAPAVGLLLWGAFMLSRSPTLRSTGWFSLGASIMVLLAWNRGALVGLGRFGFVGTSFVVEGVARLGLPVLFVTVGLGLEGASAGLALGLLLALVFTEVSIPRVAAETRQPLGRDVWVALLGLFALGLTQIVDVFAIRLANAQAAGPYVGAASLARMALFSQMPAAAYALRRAAMEGPRKSLNRTLFLALAPGLAAIALIELAPQFLLHLAYGGRFGEMAGTLRILGLAMLMGGFATVAAQLLMGARSVAWVWTIVPVSAVGTVAIITMANAPNSVAIFSLAIQGGALLAVGLAAFAVLRLSAPTRGREAVLILNWRDTRHPQGGGSEVYVERLAERLAAGGRSVTVFCAAHPNAPGDEVVRGVRFLRRGTWRTVYWWAFAYHTLGRFGPHDVVIDVKNGVPFFAPMYCRRPVVCLVHHIHQEQWGMNFSRRQARLGWWIESRLSTRLYRRTTHVAVSEATKRELVALGAPAGKVHVVHNGSDEVAPVTSEATCPTVACLGRLVPHKRVEFVLDAAAALRSSIPGLRVVIIGAGPWAGRLREHAQAVGVTDLATFVGWVDEGTKTRLLSEAWVLAMPSVKEGWGLAVTEAAACRTPAVAFRVGGLEESVADGQTGILVDDVGSFGAALATLLADHELRTRLGAEAARRASAYSWDLTVERFEALIHDLLRRRIMPVGTEAVIGIQAVSES